MEGSYHQTSYENNPCNRLFVTEYKEDECIPLDENESEEIVLGDGGKFIEVLGHISYLYSPGTMISVTGGHRLTDANLSSELPYRAFMTLFGNRWGVHGGVNGVFSLNDSEYIDDPENRIRVFSPVTKQFNGTNRSWMRIFAGTHYIFSSARMELEVGQIQSGTWMDQGIDVGLSFIMIVGKTDTKESRINVFKEYSEEAVVEKVSPRGRFVRINRGTAGRSGNRSKSGCF